MGYETKTTVVFPVEKMAVMAAAAAALGQSGAPAAYSLDVT